MKEMNNPQVELFLDAIVVRFDNRRIGIYPHEHGMELVFKRVVTSSEKEKLKNDPESKIVSTATIIKGGNRIVESQINVSNDAMFLLSSTLFTYQRELRTRQILNTVMQNEFKPEALLILNHATEDEFMEVNEIFENGDRATIDSYLDAIKRRLCGEGILTQSDNDHFGKPLIEII